jgi:hypothetical protein
MLRSPVQATVLLLAACTGAPPAPPVDPLDTLEVEGPERTCLERRCADSLTTDALAACRAEECAPREEAWSLVPTAIRHQDEVAFVQARLGYAPGGFGPVDVPRDREAYVGVTLVTSEGEEIDLAVTTVFPGQLEAPFTLTSEVGPDVQDVIFGVWDRKIEPCDSERMGCREYGFLLDGSLATWPPGVYEEGVKQRIPDGPLSLRLVDAGAGPALVDALEPLTEQLGADLAIFDQEPGAVTVRPGAVSDTSVVRHRHDHDRLLARHLARRAAGEASGAPRVVHDPGASADFVVELAGEAEPPAACADRVDQAYVACLRDGSAP